MFTANNQKHLCWSDCLRFFCYLSISHDQNPFGDDRDVSKHDDGKTQLKEYIWAMEYLSKQRFDELLTELNYLIDVVYPEVRENVAETSAQGDRSENAGYREARRIQAKTISRIKFLQRVLENSRVIDPEALPKDRVCLLSTVEFTNLATNTRMKFQIVGPHEMNLEAGKISLKSPIGASLMGKKVGEIAEAQVPSGTLRLKIESITLD